MNGYDKLFAVGYFLLIIFIQCKWQSALFKANKPISHVKHAIYYLLTIGPAVWFFCPIWWQVIVIGVAERLAFFDPILNLVRGKPLLYNSDRKAESIIDRIENKFSVFWINVMKVAYVVAFIIVIIRIK